MAPLVVVESELREELAPPLAFASTLAAVPAVPEELAVELAPVPCGGCGPDRVDSVPELETDMFDCEGPTGGVEEVTGEERESTTVAGEGRPGR